VQPDKTRSPTAQPWQASANGMLFERIGEGEAKGEDKSQGNASGNRGQR
jgi:hypothetical protein